MLDPNGRNMLVIDEINRRAAAIFGERIRQINPYK